MLIWIYFSLIPLVTGVLQYLFPDGPFYSYGFFFVVLTIYIFIINEEKSKNIKEINDFILDNIIVNGEKVNNSYNIDYSYLDFTKENTITINCHNRSIMYTT
mgnify:CR=1 FL=1